MIIEKNIEKYVVNSQESIRTALIKIGKNKRGYVFVIDSNGILIGMTTDGDIRRWLIKQNGVDLDQPIINITNKDIVFSYINQDVKRIESKFTSTLCTIPLVDNGGRLVAVADPSSQTITIAGRIIGESEPVFIIAEIGNNHNGSVEQAKHLVDLAIEAGADCVKFQMRELGSLYANSGSVKDIKEDLGSQYTLDLLNRFNLSPQQMFEVFDYCKKRGVLFFCTPWDINSLRRLEEYGLPAYKIGSPDLTNHELLNALAKIGKPLICSTGMSSEGEIRAAVQIFKQHGVPFALLHCNSTYPAPFQDINLRYLSVIKEIGECPVGYSGHERGINIAMAAVALGAKIIEKHFTADRNLEGNDHRVSLLPDEFCALVQGIREVEASIGTIKKSVLSQGELLNREVLGKSLVVNCDIKAGETIEEQMISIKSPGKGLPPYKKKEVIGIKAPHDFKSGDFIFPDDIGESVVLSKNYKFRRPWGIPVRYHDFAKFNETSSADLNEFHFSYRDLEENVEQYFIKKNNKRLIVHAPELFADDHLLDLVSLDKKYRLQSIKNLQTVIDLTLKIKKFFNDFHKPLVIVHVGGARLEKMVSAEERKELYELLVKSLKSLNYDQNELEILPETMPPLPWHFGGQRYHNIFVDPTEIVSFCTENNFRICLDVAHSKLACNYYRWSFNNFLEKVCPFAAHYHISDASGVDGEGLQIQEGEIDLKTMSEMMDKHSPLASFIPEIWQGHKDDCKGFWQALNKLERWL